MTQYSGFTSDTAEKLLLNAGAFFRNFVVGTDTFESAVTGGKLLGATRGGGEFSAIPTIRNIEVDGVLGKAQGLQKIDEWVVKMKANMLEVSKEIIADSIGASKIDTITNVDYDIITAKPDIDLSDYKENVTFVGKLSGSNKPVIIQVYNAMNSNGLTLQTQPKNEAIIVLEYEGHFDHDNLDQIPFAIFYPKPPAPAPIV